MGLNQSHSFHSHYFVQQNWKYIKSGQLKKHKQEFLVVV